jgi:hypothetical protein
MTPTLKMRALNAIRALGKPTANQIASHLPHEMQKTRAAIADLMQHGLARNAGMIEGYTVYEVTIEGLAALKNATDAASVDRNATTAPPADDPVAPLLASTPTSTSEQAGNIGHIEIPVFRETTRTELQPQPRFGLLNTQELMILIPGREPLILPAKITADLGELLSRRVV